MGSRGRVVRALRRIVLGAVGSALVAGALASVPAQARVTTPQEAVGSAADRVARMSGSLEAAERAVKKACKKGKKGKKCRAAKKRAAKKRAAKRRAAARARAKLMLPGSRPALPITARPRHASALKASGLAAARATLVDLRARSSASDPRYWSPTGRWIDGSSGCVRCPLGPAVLSATVAGATGDRVARAQAISSFNYVIRRHLRSDGAIVPAARGEGNPAIQTLLFNTQLAAAYVNLGPHLDAATRASWRSTIRAGSRYLVARGMVTWYTNGNINLALSMLLDVAAKITGDPSLRRSANQAVQVTLRPPPRWRGFGIRYTRKPTRSDGSDGAGFLAESGGGAPGFDPAYTLVQGNLAAQWYLLTGNPVARRLANLFVNQMMPRVRRSDWTVDVSGGTRRAAAGVRYTFSTSAVSVLATWGGRTDLQRVMAGQMSVLLKDYRRATTYVHPSMSFGYGLEMSTALQAMFFLPASGGLTTRRAAR